jgi:protease I
MYMDPYQQSGQDDGQQGYFYPAIPVEDGQDGGSDVPYPTGVCTIEPTYTPYPEPTGDTGSSWQDTPQPVPSPSCTPAADSDVSALVVIAPRDYNEEELSGVTRALEEKGISYDIASTSSGQATGMSGGGVEVSRTLEEVQSEGYDPYRGIILIGGEGAMTSLYDDIALRELVKKFDQEERIVAAICASPVVLSRAGILQGKTVTLFGDPQGIAEIQAAGGVVKEEEAVITDGRIITGNGTYAATEFGKTVASALLQ